MRQLTSFTSKLAQQLQLAREQLGPVLLAEGIAEAELERGHCSLDVLDLGEVNILYF